jgi:hypothetical protein
VIEGVHIGLLLVVVHLWRGLGVPLWIIWHQVVALQFVHVKGHHVRALLHEALMGDVMGVYGAPKHVIAKAHKLVVWWVPIPSVSSRG